MSKVSQILEILNVIDVIDTVDLISDMEIDNNLMSMRAHEPVSNEEALLEEIKIPQRPLRDMTNPVEMFTNDEFKERYSLSKDTVMYILQLIVHGLERSNRRGKPVPPLIELLVTLKFMITGSFQSMIDDLHGISQPTISRLIEKVSFLLAELRHIYIKYPSRTEIKLVSKQFQYEYNMANIIGCLGVTHVGIKNPGGELSEAYMNENGYFSFKVQVVCGANMEFLDFLAKWPGSTHESKIFDISDLKYDLDARDTEGYLLAGSTYPPMKHLLTPIENPISSAEIKYNNVLKEAYTVTKAVDIWKRRFKCLTTVLANKEETTKSVIQATAVLHNIALKHNEVLDDFTSSSLITEPRCKEVKRQLPIDKPLETDESAITAREKYIKKYFSS